MKWITHLHIARAIADALELNDEFANMLCEASIAPDKNPDRILKVGPKGKAKKAKIPHHAPNKALITHYVLDARKSFLRSSYSRATASLGRALHYVQDMSLDTGMFGKAHDLKETELADYQAMIPTINAGIKEAFPSYGYVENIVKKIKPMKNLDEAMYQACFCSAAIAKAVLGERKPPESLVASFKKAKEKYFKRTVPMIIVICTVSFILSIAFVSPFPMMFGIPFGYIVQLLSSNYRRLKKEMEWFNP